VSIPNILTLARIILIPIFVLAYYLPVKYSALIAAGIFTLAAFTDLIDGYLARKLSQTSTFGAFLDPVADKLLVAVSLVLLVGTWHSIWITIPAAIIVSREIAISALREWMAEVGKRASIAVSFIGKAKTFLQMLGIGLLLSQPPEWDLKIVWLGLVCIYIAVGLTTWSMIKYMQVVLHDAKYDS